MAKEPTNPVIPSRLYRDQLVTLGDLEDFKQELLLSLVHILQDRAAAAPKKWLKSHEVRRLLRISHGTLHTMRANGTLPYTKIGNIIYYEHTDIELLLSKRKHLAEVRPTPDAK